MRKQRHLVGLDVFEFDHRAEHLLKLCAHGRRQFDAVRTGSDWAVVARGEKRGPFRRLLPKAAPCGGGAIDPFETSRGVGKKPDRYRGILELELERTARSADGMGQTVQASLLQRTSFKRET